MFWQYYRDIKQRFLVFLLAISFANRAQGSRGSAEEMNLSGSEYFQDTDEYGGGSENTQYNVIQWEAQPYPYPNVDVPTNEEGLIIDQFVDLSNETFNEVDYCLKNIISVFNNFTDSASCKTYAMLHLSFDIMRLTNNKYALKYFDYLKENTSKSQVQSPSDYLKERPEEGGDLQDLVDANKALEFKPKPRSRYAAYGIFRKKRKEALDEKDDRLVWMEAHFGSKPEEVVLLTYDQNVIQDYRRYPTVSNYITYVEANVDFNANALSPSDYCSEYYKPDVPLNERTPLCGPQ